MHVSLISDESIKELTQGTEYTITDRVVTLSAPTTLKIKIYRQTTTTPLVGWADASVLRAADMNVQSTQLLHLAEETSDLAQDGGLSKDTTDNVWDARFNKIKNILEPTDPGDAVTLSYIMKNQTGLLTQLNATGDNQNTRLINTGDAQNTRLTTTGNTQNTRLTTTGDTQNKRLTDTGDTYVATMTTLKGTATTQATNASNSASSASTSASTATTKATEASNSASSASTSASTATTKATEASNSANLSKAWAMSDSSPDGVSGNKSSKTWANEAKNSASSAKTSETNAKASETNAANSATAAAQSADRAATFDPSSYYNKTETYNKTEVNDIKNNIISKPLVGNAVLWDYLHRLGRNPTLPTTNDELNALGMFMSYFDQNKIANQPGQYGQLLNIPATKDASESTQIWIEQSGGRMYHRGGNGGIAVNNTPFKRFLDTDDLSAAGVVAGNVSNSNAWWVKLGGTIPLIIQGIYYASTGTYTFPITFPTKALGASATGSINYRLTNTAIEITDMNVGDKVKQPGFVLCVGY